MSLLIGFIVTKYELDQHWSQFGLMCACVTSVPSLIAAICFYRAGYPYEAIKLEQEEEAKEAIEVVKLAGVRQTEEALVSFKQSIFEMKRSIVKTGSVMRFNRPHLSEHHLSPKFEEDKSKKNDVFDSKLVEASNINRS